MKIKSMKKHLIPGLIIFVLITAFGNKPKDALKLSKAFKAEFAYVPNGAVSVESNSYEIGAFYASRTEVSNAQYREFLAAMDTAGDEVKQIIAIQNDNWKKGRYKAEPFAEYYHAHEAYRNYPVVNISHEAAKLYCEWLTAYYSAMDIGLPSGMQLIFRLPKREEWVYLANGGLNGPYAWGGPFIRNKKGCELANFLPYGSENITYDAESNSYRVISVESDSYMGTPGNYNRNADVTAPVRSYAPNGHGVYNMNGNVAEMLSEPGVAAGGAWLSPGYDIRNESLMGYESASPEVGFRPIAVLSAI